MSPFTKTNSLKAPEIWFKGQRVLRTAFTTALTLLPVVPQIIAIVQGQWGAEWLTVVSAQFVAINSALTRIIAIPAINDLLTKIGLGSVPASQVEFVNEVNVVDEDPEAEEA